MQRLFAIVVGILLLGACARVDVYRLDDADALTKTDSTGTKKINGVHFFKPHPYLLVTVEPGDKPENPKYVSTIVYLPEDEYVATVRPGWGTVNGSISLNDSGSLTQFGSQLDSKIPETITAVSGLLTAAVGAVPAANVPAGALSPGLYRLIYKDGQVIGVSGNLLRH